MGKTNKKFFPFPFHIIHFITEWILKPKQGGVIFFARRQDSFEVSLIEELAFN